MSWLEQAELLRMLSEGLQVGLRVSLEGSVEETQICFSVEWSLQEAVPRPGKPGEAFITVTRAATTRSRACRSTGGRCPELRVDRST